MKKKQKSDLRVELAKPAIGEYEARMLNMHCTADCQYHRATKIHEKASFSLFFFVEGKYLKLILSQLRWIYSGRISTEHRRPEADIHYATIHQN